MNKACEELVKKLPHAVGILENVSKLCYCILTISFRGSLFFVKEYSALCECWFIYGRHQNNVWIGVT